MRPGISKYRQQQSTVKKPKKKKASDDLATRFGSGGATYDQVVLSEEVAEKLAQEAAEEQASIDIDEEGDEVEEILARATAQATSASTSNPVNARTIAGNVKRDGKDRLGTREEIILEYAPLIKYVAQKIAARLPANIELDDLISSGVIGLMDAIEKYDPSRDNKFKTYAEFRIRGAILDELRAQDWVPRSIREKAKALERAYAKIEHDKGRPATDEEVCEELKVSQEEFYELLNQVRSVSLLSYDDLNSFSKTDKRAILGLSEGSRSSTPFSEVNVATLKKTIAEAIRDLPEKQRLVLSLYYYEDLNLKEIGKVLDVTESRVSQLHTQAILKLKARLKNNFDDFILLFG